jgi:hypothetical protein
VDAIKFEGKFSDGIKKIELTAPGGAGENWFVYIDNYYCGSFNKMSDGWMFFGNDKGNALLTPIAQKRMLNMILTKIAGEQKS